MSDEELPTADAGEGAADAGTEEVSFDSLESTYDELEATEGLPEKTLAEIKKLRGEHKRYRERYSPYSEAFDNLHENDRNAILGMTQMLREGNLDGLVQFMVENSKALAGDKWDTYINPVTGEEEPVLDDVASEAEAPDISELVKRQVQEILDAERAAQTEQAESKKYIGEIESKLSELGYDDPSSARAKLVLLAARDLGGDPLQAIEKAHEEISQQLAEDARKYLAEKSADSGRPSTLKGDPAAGTEPTETDPVALMKARLDDVFSSPT